MRGRHESTHGARPGWAALALGAVGVVFGDIGTSPLYALQTVFAIDGGAVRPDRGDTYGVISLVFWSVTVVVSMKYVGFILRADNDGEGGVMALAALARRAVSSGPRRTALVMVLGVVGASLLYGDSVITPAISVMSAIEGLSVTDATLRPFEVPLAAAIIAGLFLWQRVGTARVGRLFGPVMVSWFVVVAALGVGGLAREPAILWALSPTWCVTFFVSHPGVAFVAMGAVVLSITGAEALYADLGHFGRRPIRRAWFGLVFPCLVLNYLGQGALLLRDPSRVSDPFYLLAPSWASVPLVVLATAATVIASQAVISGAYSVSRQAERLGYLPRLTIRHTSTSEGGQIYVPAVNWWLFAAVMALLLAFQSSQRLATAYGVAVTGTFLLTTVLFLLYAHAAWGWSRRRILLAGAVFGALEVTYFAANLTKITRGGWIPVVIAAAVATVMLTWRTGAALVTSRRRDMEGPMSCFLDELHHTPVDRVPGTAIFLHPHADTTPLALRENVKVNHVLHEQVLIVRVVFDPVPYVPKQEQASWYALGPPEDHLIHVDLHFGFQDDQQVPRALRTARGRGLPVDGHDATYFLSKITIEPGHTPGMRAWRQKLFITLAHNATSSADYFRLPRARTISVGTSVAL